jgi:hypothetical protein
MRKPPRTLVLLVSAPFLTGCFTVLPTPVPPPSARNETTIKGVVVGDIDSGEWIEFDEVYDVQWSDQAVSIVGSRVETDGASPVDVTRLFQLRDLGAVLTRQIDPGRTSIVVAGVLVGAIGTIMVLITGDAAKY